MSTLLLYRALYSLIFLKLIDDYQILDLKNIKKKLEKLFLRKKNALEVEVSICKRTKT